ncbi:MAG TPA: membrane protein insertase YidC [Bryobacteraceae bacterium]|nr:membrane protein insertase YidC [Bryobacteraceae bacterium]
MADNPDPKKPSKGAGEISVEQRMLLAFGLVGLVLVLSQYLFSPAAPSRSGPTQEKPATARQIKEPQKPAPAPPAAPSTPGAQGENAAGIVRADTSETFVIDTDVYRIVFSNHGAVVRSWTLKNYRDSAGRPLELVNTDAAQKTHYPFSLLYDGQQPSTDLNKVFFATAVSPDKLGITFNYSDGRSSGRKSFRFGRNSYLLDVSSEVREGTATVPHLLAWRGGFGDRTAYAAAASMKTLYFSEGENKLVENEAKVAKDGPVLTSGNYSFGGIEDTYFLAVFLPKDRGGLRVQTLSDSVAIAQGAGEEAIAGVGIGSEGLNTLQAFVGPKDLDLLRKVNPKLESAVDFGWFTFLARPIFLALNWLNDNWVRNYGWSIILLTILINMLLLPLKISGMKGMKKMAALQPEIQAINEKYKNISIRDPRKAQQNEEVMALYKKHGVNPLGAGCMPLVLQIPFFFAFYKVLSIAIELRGADWLWIRDLAQFDPWYLLPVVMVITQFVLQKMTPSTTADPAQQKMMLFMPLLFGFLFFKASAGLVLYWLTGNIVGILQQWLINRMGPAPAPAAASAVVNARPAAGKKNRK